MKALKFGVLILLITSLGCKSTKGVSNSGNLNNDLSVKQIIRENSKKNAKFKKLQTKVKIEFTQDNKAQGYTVNLRMEKDKTIWISATLGLARAMITPDKVRFYDKINNQYFDGDYALLSNLLGIELDFNKVQSLLLGESIFNLKNDTYIASTNEASYVLQPKEQRVLLELFLLLNPAHFKMDSQQLYQPLKKRFLQIDYMSYQEVERQILPKNMKIIAVEDTEEVLIDMEFKSISLNQDLRFPFRIPSGFKEIVLANE